MWGMTLIEYNIILFQSCYRHLFAIILRGWLTIQSSEHLNSTWPLYCLYSCILTSARQWNLKSAISNWSDLRVDWGVPFPWTTALGINRGGGRGFLEDEITFPFSSFFDGVLSSDDIFVFSFWLKWHFSLTEEPSIFAGDCELSDWVTVSVLLSEEAIGDLISDGAFTSVELLNFACIPIFSSFSPSLFLSCFVLLRSGLFPLFRALFEMVKVNLDLWDCEARGAVWAGFVVDVVNGLVTVEVDGGLRWKWIPDLTGVPRSRKSKD